MKILASLCNINDEVRSGLMVFEEDLSSYRHLKPPEGVPRVSITGIALSDDEIIASVQGGGILILDRKTLELKSSNPLGISLDTHSLLLHEERLYAVAAGINAVVSMDLKNGVIVSEEIFWKISDETDPSDNVHLNSICVHEGTLLVSGFGKRESCLWSSAKHGFVIDIKSRKVLHKDIHQPHTLMSYRGAILICESEKGRVLDLSNRKEAVVGGYVRGLCAGKEGLYAAVSRGRTVSRSTGLVLTNPGDEGDLKGYSAIYLIDQDTFTVKKAVETGEFEFYDLSIVGGEADDWPVHNLVAS